MTDNKKIIEEHYAGFQRRDFAAVMAPLDESIVWTEAAGSPFGGTYVGPQTVAAQVFAAIERDWDEFRFAPDEILTSGQHVIAVGTYTGINKGTGRSFAARVVHVWRLRNGKAVRFEQIADTELLIRATE